MSEPRPLDFLTGVAIAGWALATSNLTLRTLLAYGAPAVVAEVMAPTMAAAVVVFGVRGPGWRARLGLSLPHARYVVAAILLGLSVGFAATPLNTRVAGWIAPTHPSLPLYYDVLWASILIHAVVPAIGEELIFRGVLLRGLAARWRPISAVVASAIVFMLAHHSPNNTVTALVLGLITAHLALRSGSIVPAMIVHFTQNAKVALVDADFSSPSARWLADHRDQMVFAGVMGVMLGLFIARSRPASRSAASTDPAAPAP